MNCPSCGHLSDEDFGLVVCSACGHQFMVEVNGQSVEPKTKPKFEFTLSSNKPRPLDNFTEEAPHAEEDQSAQASLKNFDLVTDDPMLDPVQDNFGDYPDGMVADTPPMVPNQFGEEEIVVSHSEFADVVAFANSQESQATQGTLTYNLKIAGIDTSEIREEVKLLFSEPRLRLNVEHIFKTIKDGEIILNDISAVKAAYLVKELTQLHVDVSYQQKGIFKDE